MLTRICNTCKKEKFLEEFNKDSSRKYGVRYRCRLCDSKYHKKYFFTHKNKVKARNNKNYWLNKEQRSLKAKDYYKENKEIIISRQKKYVLLNPEKIKAKHKRHYSANKYLYNAKSAKRRAAKLNATPSWLTESHFEEIKQYYCNRPEGYHVDHIIPLQGETVCGLHVPWNLQYLEAKDNISKGNKIME